jgi:photosystem II stability/assembly factor-like uncharacterized protein
MKRFVARILTIGAMLSVAACYRHGEPAPAPGGVSVTEGDQSVTVAWTPDAGVTYWVWCAQSTSITTDNAFLLPGLRIITDAATPAVVAGLVNGTTYSCMVNGRINGGPGGPGSPSISKVPRLAGANWTPGGNTVISATTNLRGATYGATFVAVGDAGGIFNSTDGKTWTAVTPLNSNNLYAAAYGGSYVAVGQSGTILTSADAITWASQTSGATSDLNAVATTGGGYYVAVGQAGTILYSSGGTTWTVPTTLPALPSENLTGAAYGGGRFVAVGDQGSILTSTDGGVNWTSQSQASSLYAVAYGVDTTQTPNVAMFVAVGAAGAVLTSTDGTAWTARTPISTSLLRAVTYGRQFIAVGDTGVVYTSTDGVNWQPQVSSTTNNLLAIAHNSVAGAPFGYVAVGTSGTNLTAY